MCYFGDKNAFNEIVELYDNLQDKIKWLEQEIDDLEMQNGVE